MSTCLKARLQNVALFSKISDAQNGKSQVSSVKSSIFSQVSSKSP